MSEPRLPLSKYTVLDLTAHRAGPTAVRQLADWGANVIKIEAPASISNDKGSLIGSRNGFDFQNLHRNKRSLTLNLKTEEGKAVFFDLAKKADIIVENFRSAVKFRLGIDYDEVKKVNPRIIYGSIAGFGQTGPYAQRPGYDFLIQGMGGLMSVTGAPDTEGGGPVKVGVAVTDLFTGLYASNAIQAALLERHQSGLGQYIDLALLDVQAAVLANQASNYLIGGTVPQRLGNAHPNIVPYQAFATTDGHIILAVGNEGQFKRLCQVLKKPEWLEDSRYSSNAARVKNRDALCSTISKSLAQHSNQHWLRVLEQHEVPCGPINTIDQVFKDPQILARNMLVTAEDERAGEIQMVANPINFSRSEIDYAAPPPQIGNDTASVSADYLEYSHAELEALRKKSVI